MHPLLLAALANNLSTSRVTAAEDRRTAKTGKRSGARAPASDEVVIRRATGGDAAALVRLGTLDGDRRAGESLAHNPGAVLVAEVDGRLEAALALDDGVTVADPFRPSAVDVELLALRARQLGGHAPRHHRARLSVLHPRTS